MKKKSAFPEYTQVKITIKMIVVFQITSELIPRESIIANGYEDEPAGRVLSKGMLLFLPGSKLKQKEKAPLIK